MNFDQPAKPRHCAALKTNARNKNTVSSSYGRIIGALTGRDRSLGGKSLQWQRRGRRQ
jgi:hypothetical protein